MAEFSPAFKKMIDNEGGYVLHKIEGDRGGQTYAGIARNFWPDWYGWSFIDKKDFNSEELKLSVNHFYKEMFWNKMKCNHIIYQNVSESIFDFSVNSGIRVASRIVQLTVGATPDGIIGEKTLKAINDTGEELFIARFALAKIVRYAQICNKNRSQSKFLLGWINRSLRGI